MDLLRQQWRHVGILHGIAGGWANYARLRFLYQAWREHAYELWTIYNVPSISDAQLHGRQKIRDNFYNSTFVPLFAPLLSAGISVHLGWYPDLASENLSVSTWISALQQLDDVNPGHIFGLAGPNQADVSGTNFAYGGLTGVAAGNLAQKDIYAAVKANKQLNYVPVDMWPVGDGYDMTFLSQVGDMTAFCDRANMHDYYEADNYSGVGLVAQRGYGRPDASLSRRLSSGVR